MFGRRRLELHGLDKFLPDPATWFARLMAAPGIQAAPFFGDMAVAASYLPGMLHRDPADRLRIATARNLAVAVVTRGTRMAAYAANGFVDMIAC